MTTDHPIPQITRLRGMAVLPTIALAPILAFLVLWIIPRATVAISGYTGNAGPVRDIEDPRVVVIKSQKRLFLFNGTELVRSYPVRTGQDGASGLGFVENGQTPTGQFRICMKNIGSANHRFLALDYPPLDLARQAMRAGLLSTGEVAAIADAHDRGICPPWSTPLGGGIGIHGSADAANQTAGCIALRNEDVAELFDVLRSGDPVEVLP